MADNVKIVSAQYANAQGTLVFALLENGESWFVVPNNGSGQANVLQSWLDQGNNVGPYVPVIPGGVIPVGSVIWLATTRAVPGYLVCDGAAIRRQQFINLFRAIGTTFGAGDGTTTFNLPDLRGKFIRGWGATNALDPGRVFGSTQLGSVGSHTHSITDPGHTHTVNDPGHFHPVQDPGHQHTFTDPGHNHGVTDPGHKHTSTFYTTGYAAAYNSGKEVLSADRNNGDITSGTDYATADVRVNPAPTNMIVDPATTNLGVLYAETGIAINDGVTNILRTEQSGGFETRPVNVTMIPLIRY